MAHPLAQAGRIAMALLIGIHVCRALMKYRAGHGEERMTTLSQEYCRRARAYLREIGSPLRAAPGEPSAAYGVAKRGDPRRRAALNLRGPQFWAAHEARIKLLTAQLMASQMRKASAAAGGQPRNFTVASHRR